MTAALKYLKEILLYNQSMGKQSVSSIAFENEMTCKTSLCYMQAQETKPRKVPRLWLFHNPGNIPRILDFKENQIHFYKKII